MGLLDYDYAELAERVQRGLDRLTANYLAAHGARVRLDVLDFHGREHLDFEITHGGHHLRVRQLGIARAIGEAGDPVLEEFESLFNGRPSRDTPAEIITAWLRALPAGTAAPQPRRAGPDPDNPLLAEARPAPSQPIPNPFLKEHAQQQPNANPFGASGEADARKRRALKWLGGDE